MTSTPKTLQLKRNDWVPNNPRLPVLVYRQALQARDLASGFETMFECNGWPPQRRGTVVNFHHYHSTAHEVLGFFAGSAHLVLGGPGGTVLDVTAGDALVLPVGTGHCRIEATSDFRCVGAYPPKQTFDICTQAPTGEMQTRMARLPFPHSDPVAGIRGPMSIIWRRRYTHETLSA
jgi:uncharacterized protein YjlB